jgi:hypothetical protein
LLNIQQQIFNAYSGRNSTFNAFSHPTVVAKKNLNFTFRYIDDVISLNNSRFGDFVDRIYPIELEIKDTTDTDRSAS